LHLDDGTHLHLVELWPKGKSKVGVWYIQGPHNDFIELSDVMGMEDMKANGLANGTVITANSNAIPGGKLVVNLNPVDHTPLRLADKITGEVAMFPRSWCEVTTSDRRRGTGWIEWNLLNYIQDEKSNLVRK
jgi:hypothetical protein